MTRSERPWGAAVAVAAPAALVVAVMGATVTDIGFWYHTLRQPGWAPPEQAYPIVWTLIYALTALAAVSTWRAATTRRQVEDMIGLFALNGFLNILWSLLFFRFHRPDWALIEAAALWLSVLSLVLFTGRLSRTAGLLLLPYLAWITLATALNAAVVQLNGPFG